MSHDDHFNADPVFLNGDRWAAEEERRLEIAYDDSFCQDKTKRRCYRCELFFDVETMVDYESDSYIWKICSVDSAERLHQSPLL